MMAIEKFTKQQIPVQAFPEFMPEEGEKAEPIAMGRQTLWGGAGKPPSREVMAAAGKAARQEMMTRIRDKKANDGQGQGRGQRGEGRSQGQGQRQGQGRPAQNAGGQPQRPQQRPQGEGRPQHARGEQRPQKAHQGPHRGEGHHGGGQPDPLRTGIDSLGSRGGRNNRGRGRPGGGNGGGGQGGGGIDPLRTRYGHIK